MRFLNREQLLANAAEGLQDARGDALSILERAVDAVEPANLLRDALRVKDGVLLVSGDPFVPGPGSDEDLAVPLRNFEAIRCIAAGKAAEGMLQHLPAQLRITEGFAATPTPNDARAAPHPPAFPVLETGHPLPDERSVTAGARALDLARATGERDLLLVLLSGGASAAMEQPLVPLEDLRSVTQDLLDAGAGIDELNKVRSKLSALKGGQLAAACKGRVLTLILSDVLDDHARLVGSGPTAPDATTNRDADNLLDALKVEPPASVRRVLGEGHGVRVPPGSPCFARTDNIVLGSNARAAHEAADFAGELGYQAFWVREPLVGSPQRAGWKLARMAEDITLGKAPLPRPACIVFGGETTVDVRGSKGLGGRNQELALAAMEALRVEATLACMGTDGIDGPTPAAGALVDMGSRERSDALGLDRTAHLQRHDSHTFFAALGDALLTGPTGTNVADLSVLLVR